MAVFQFNSIASLGRAADKENMSTFPTELNEHYDTHGYVIIPGLTTPSEHADLLAATGRVVARSRSGAWPHARVVGKQFPPYGTGDDIWGVQHAMHPELGEPVFARWYAGYAMRGAARTLLGCRDEELQMGGCRSHTDAPLPRITRVSYSMVGYQNCSISS
jgi:hypothetical protein